MFGTKFNKEAFARGYGRIKNQLGNAYFRTKAILGNIDEHVNMAKKVYKELQPALPYYAGADKTNALNNKLVTAAQGYDALKSKVLQGHEAAGQHLKNAMNVASAVKRVIDTGLR
jgi:hypothetical protein